MERYEHIWCILSFYFIGALGLPDPPPEMGPVNIHGEGMLQNGKLMGAWELALHNGKSFLKPVVPPALVHLLCPNLRGSVTQPLLQNYSADEKTVLPPSPSSIWLFCFPSSISRDEA